MAIMIDARNIDESGVFPTVHLDEVDVGGLLSTVLDEYAFAGPLIEIVRSGVYEYEAMVLGDRARLSGAFAKLVATCVACVARGTVLRVTLRRELDGWSVITRHSVAPDVPLDEGIEELAFTRSVLLGHGGAFAVWTDPVRRVRMTIASLPRARP